jgi:type-F conjugative transfer system pilin assembly protein TrbC
MLRILMALALSPLVFAEYQEPTTEALIEQQAFVLDALKKADKVDPMIGFKSELDKLNGVNTKQLHSGFNDLNLPKRDGLNGLFSSVESAAFSKQNKPTVNAIAPIILVSQSIPIHVLKNILIQAKEYEALVVVRGLPNGEFLDEVHKLQRIAEGTGTGLAIDPTLFKRFNVTSVPAFVLPLTPLIPCTENGCSTPEHVKATGDVTIRYFLELIERVGTDAEKEIARTQLLKVGSSH